MMLSIAIGAVARSHGVGYFSLVHEVCNAEGCLTRVPGSTDLFSWDYGHLTTAGAAFYAKRLSDRSLIGD